MSTGQPTRPTRTGLLLSGGSVLALLILVGSLAGNLAHPSSPTFSLSPVTPGPAAWARITLPPDGALADLAPTRLEGRRVATTTAFTIKALGHVAVADLASLVTAEPPVTFTIEPGPTADTAVLSPTAPLQPGTRYRFNLAAPDGSHAGTWTFRTDSPLHVVGRLPDDESTSVPLTTGIETTFDQDTPIDFEAHFAIAPATPGRFERHERTWVFVPDKPLRPATIYTVTVSHGVRLDGSDQTLEDDVRWQFETEASATSDAVSRISVPRPVLEFRPNATLDLVVELSVPDGVATPAKVPFELYRLATLDAAAGAAARLLSGPSWAEWAAASRVDPSGLAKVASGNATVTNASSADEGIQDVRLPVQPDPGWYLLQFPNGGRPAQAVLQITDLAAYVLTTETRTVAWVNDLASIAPVPDALIRVVGGATLGRTDGQGLVTTTTPSSLARGAEAQGATNIVSVTAPDGRQLLAPLGEGSWGYPAEDNSPARASGSPDWWLLLSTDRTTYRSTDTIHAWGVIRDRADYSVPTGLELRMSLPDQSAGAPLRRVPVSATKRGVFSGDVSFSDLPHGSYEVSLYAGDQLISSQWVEVAEIRKPAYSIDLRAARHAYVVGDSMTLSGSLRFFDGTAVPGISLVATNGDDSASTPVTAGPDGRFEISLPARAPDSSADSQLFYLGVRPATPEEGAISGSDQVIVFPSSRWLSGSVSVSGSTFHASATLTSVDLDAVEAQLASGSYVTDPSGAPVAGTTVKVTWTELIPVRHQTGTTYDFVTKHVTPVYEYTTETRTLATVTRTSGPTGVVTFDGGVGDPSHQYEITFEAEDARHRPTSTTVLFGQAVQSQPNTRPYLVSASGCGWSSEQAAIGSTTDLTVHDGDGAIAGAGPYLFVVGEDGLVNALLQSSATYSRPFTASDVPSYTARAIRLTSHGYEATSPFQVDVAPASKTLGVTVSPLSPRYAPGDTATVEIRTTSPAGKPVPADVIVRAIDEKLFSIGAALDVDPVSVLMQPRSSGFLQSFASHQVPLISEGGCGSTGGGRDDFRDSATFQHVRTDAAGQATVSFHLPDDLTSWHVTATAVSSALDSGSGSALVPVGLPFFVDAILAPEYLAGDSPSVVVRAYGEAVKPGDPVRLVVRSSDLGLAPVTIDGRAGEAIRIPLGTVPPGDAQITIDGTAAGGTLADSLVRTVHVVPTRLKALRMSQQTLGSGSAIDGGPGLTTYVVTDAGRGSILPILQGLLSSDGARFDQAAPADLARQLLVDEFDVPTADLPPSTYDPTRYTRTGVTLLPYSSPDLTLTALAAIVTPERIDPEDARSALEEWSTGSGATRERLLTALAGRAALGEDVLDQLSAVPASGLSIRERIWLGIGFLESGDEADARAIERQLLTDVGQRLDPWVRLDAGSDVETGVEATADMLVLAGLLGDPLAAAMEQYVTARTSTEHVFGLQALAYVRGALDRLTRSAASFAWTLGGQRHEVSLEPGGAFAITLTAGQRATIAFERLSGDTVLTASWTGDATTVDLPHTPGLTITRSVTPSGDAPSDRIVNVRLLVSIGTGLPGGCYAVTDLLPSGLAPLVGVPGWPDDPDVARDTLTPYFADGQRVSWCIDPGTQRSYTLVYSARVVSPGTYRWEPAVMQSTTAPSIGAVSAASTYTIR